ncbi:hypothetical protein [Actinoplanes missouriensis]|uniref:hypothetical protein n=1 Tax=Actinoplanes missouriensis TaxID=1866 RepID=UPI00368D81B9
MADALPPESFEAIYNFQLRGNNKAQVRYLLARLTAYVEVGCGKHDLSAEYLNENRAWQVEHLWPNHPDWYSHEMPGTRRLPGPARQDRISCSAAPQRQRQPQRHALPREDPEVRETERPHGDPRPGPPPQQHLRPRLRQWQRQQGQRPGRPFPDFGTNPKMQSVVSSRTELYRRLCQIIWKPERLGFPTIEPQEPSEQAGNEEPAAPPRHRPTPNARTAIARMMKHGILQEGVSIFAGTSNYRASIDGDGIIWLPTGDAFVSVDEAGRAVSGLEKCDGLGFWQVTDENGTTNSLRVIHNKAKADGRLTSAQRRR